MKQLTMSLLMITVAAPLAVQLDHLYASQVSQRALVPQRSITLAIENQVLETLGRLADTLDVETARCLIGGIDGNQAVIDLAWEPPIQASTPTSVSFATCPRATLAVWHNHLSNGQELPEDACYLSQIDIEEALRPDAPQVHMVQVSSNVACWWTRRQIARHKNAAVVWPIPSQQRGSAVVNAVANAGPIQHGAKGAVRTPRP